MKKPDNFPANLPVVSTGGIEAYISFVNTIPLLTDKEEYDLAEQWRNDEDVEAAVPVESEDAGAEVEAGDFIDVVEDVDDDDDEDDDAETEVVLALPSSDLSTESAGSNGPEG